MLCCITLILYTGLVCWVAYVRRILRIISHVRCYPYRRVYRTKRSKVMFSRSTPLYPRMGIYKYTILKAHFTQRNKKLKYPKILLLVNLHMLGQVYTLISFHHTKVYKGDLREVYI